MFASILLVLLPTYTTGQGILAIPPFHSVEAGSCQTFPTEMLDDINPRSPFLTCTGLGISGMRFKYDGLDWNAHEGWFHDFQSIVEKSGSAIGLTDSCVLPWMRMICHAYFPPCNSDGAPMRICLDYCEEMHDVQYCKDPWNSLSSCACLFAPPSRGTPRAFVARARAADLLT